MSKYGEGFINKIIEELGSPAGRFNLLFSSLILGFVYLCFFNKWSVFPSLLIRINVVKSLHFALNICYKALKAGDFLEE